MSLRSFLGRGLNFDHTVTINGQRFTIPFIYRMRMAATGDWMVPLRTAIRAARSGTFVDVGVNVGQALMKAKSVDRNWDYVGFEPNPACVLYIRELCRANGFDDATIVPAGLA